MKPKSQPRDAFELFQSYFDQLLNPKHELVVLARKIDWPSLEAAFVDCYNSPDMGAPAKAVRMMVGLHYLKYTFSESDETLVLQRRIRFQSIRNGVLGVENADLGFLNRLHKAKRRCSINTGTN